MHKISRPLAVTIILIISISVSLVFNTISECSHRKLPLDECKPIVDKYAEQYNVPSYLVLAVIEVESEFDPAATSSAGACGLMQMTPKTFAWLTSSEHLGENLTPDELFDPEVSIRYGTYYLKYLFTRFHNWDTVLAAYNGGEGNVKKWLNNPNYTDEEGNLTYIPFDETRAYVSKVEQKINHYQTLYYNTKG